MVDDPESHRLERFAGQRVRMVEAIVEVRDRTPYAVARLVYEMLGFDAEGRLDRATFMRQNAALAELAMSPVIPRLEAEETAVVDAGSRFVARGGRWQPSRSLEQEILRAALGEPEEGGRVREFPRHDTQPYERFSPQPFLVAQRMDVLYRWLASPKPGNGAAAMREPAPVVVAPWTALALRVPPRETVRARSVHLEVGQTLDRDALVEVLVAAGYQRMPLVEEPGELAVRGHILDLFPPQRERPLRVELLGDEVESIREFDPASQRSQQTLLYAVAPPPRELLLSRSYVIERSEALRELAASQKVPLTASGRGSGFSNASGRSTSIRGPRRRAGPHRCCSL